jgi:DNA polymerase-3 subunit epsilon
MIENLLIIDTETTGLDVKKGAVMIEIAAVLFSVKYKTVLQSFSTLLPCEINPVENINHISAESTREDYAFRNLSNAEIFTQMWTNPESQTSSIINDPSLIGTGDILIEMNKKAQACVAHNADFDKRFIATAPWGYTLLLNKWICTKANFTWPVKLMRFRQQDVCEAMGVPYVDAHRALSDCLMLAQCFSKVEDLQERIDRC